MHKIVSIKSKDLFPLVNEIIYNNTSARLTVTGMSMYPFLRENIDSVELSSTSFESVRRGDILLIRRLTGEYVLHRLLFKNTDCFYLAGDAQYCSEGPLFPEQLIAVASVVWRGKRRIDCRTNLIWRICSSLWLYIFPYRRLVIWPLKLCRILFNKNHGELS